MARITCFADDGAAVITIRRAFQHADVSLSLFSATALSDNVRGAVRCMVPDLILLELAPGLSNVHQLFFLRADQATRSIPILLLLHAADLASYAAALGADACLRLPCSPDQLSAAAQVMLPALMALEFGSRTLQPAVAISR